MIKECRSDRDCRGFRRTSCEGRGPNFLFIFPTCGRWLLWASKWTSWGWSSKQILWLHSLTDKTRQRPYTLPGKCNRVPDTLCHIGSGYSPIVGCFAEKILLDWMFCQMFWKDALGGRNRCNDGSRCADCLDDQDCSSREVKSLSRSGWCGGWWW